MTSKTISVQSRIQGCIWGACVADALGGPVQFKEPGTFEPVYDLRPVEPFGQPTGSYSDDGAMTLALAQSFLENDGDYDHEDAIRKFVQWLDYGRFSTTDHAWDIGIATKRALRLWNQAGENRNPKATQEKVDAALGDNSHSGNGSLMRIAILGACLSDDVADAKRTARQHSAITHPSPDCQEVCELYTQLICEIMRGTSKVGLKVMISKFKPKSHDLIRRLAHYEADGPGSWERTTSNRLRSTGWVIDTFEVALWAFLKYNTWFSGALAIVNMGLDSDTAGAVYGALAGTYYGIEAIPQEWRDKMQNREMIRDISHDLGEVIARKQAKTGQHGKRG